jgi:hypothetical protein
LDRDSKLSVSVSESEVRNTLTLTLDNNADTALGILGKYKSYLRVLAPIESSFGQVEVVGQKGNQKLDPLIEYNSGHTEAGVLIEIQPGESKKITYSWTLPSELDFSRAGSIEVYWRKQAGTQADPVSISISTPVADLLTQRENSSYNTLLLTDFSQTINW